MRVRFTKMQGAGNDFVVLDATRSPFALSEAQLRRLGDRRFGVGADQILVVDPPSRPEVDFGYRIFNADNGDEVEHCGNGARCFVRYVRDKGLSTKDTLTVETMNRRLVLRLEDDGRVSVDMGPPDFETKHLPFDAVGLMPNQESGVLPLWPLDLGRGEQVEVALVSMGNPHAVLVVRDVDSPAVARRGPLIEAHSRFPRHVNAGFMQVRSRTSIRLRVFERGAGETLSCGTGACAAVATGVALGLLGAAVDVETRGGLLSIEWPGGKSPLIMTGPAETVFEGEIEL